MALFSVQIKDEDVTTVIDALCLMYGCNDTDYQAKAVFANQVVRNFIKDNVVAAAAKKAEILIQLEKDKVKDIEITDPQLES